MPFSPSIHNCSVMESYATSPELQASLVFNIFVATLATPVLLKGMWFVATKKVFHRNTRMQIMVHLVALLVHTVGRLALHSIDLYNYLSNWTSACEIIPNFYRCLALRACYNIGLALSSMCSIALVLERLAAYIYSDTYENCPMSFGLLLVLLQFALASGYLGSMYFTAAFSPGNFTLYYCQTIASSAGSIWYVMCPLYSVMVALVVSRVAFEVLMKKSEHLRTSSDISLSNRYNLDQSIRSITALKLLINLNSIVFIVLSVVTTTLHFNSEKLTPPRYIALVETVHFLPLYSIIVSFVIHSKLESMQQARAAQPIVPNENPADYYFDYFRKQMQ